MAFVNEKEFDENLKRIGDLYEEGKSCIVKVLPVSLHLTGQTAASYERLYEILREMRDIAAANLFANNEIKED